MSIRKIGYHVSDGKKKTSSTSAMQQMQQSFLNARIGSFMSCMPTVQSKSSAKAIETAEQAAAKQAVAGSQTPETTATTTTTGATCSTTRVKRRKDSESSFTILSSSSSGEEDDHCPAKIADANVRPCGYVWSKSGATKHRQYSST
jgi:hypothetical protein